LDAHKALVDVFGVELGDGEAFFEGASAVVVRLLQLLEYELQEFLFGLEGVRLGCRG
jgi:hypothetical protein